MADHSSPDYELDETLSIQSPAEFKALFDETRLQIVDLLLERAATIKELADTMDRPKGTIGHHVSVLQEAGLIRVVRTKKVRAIEAKYYGRTARTFLLTPTVDVDIDVSPDYFLTKGAMEYAKAAAEAMKGGNDTMLSTLRYVRVPDDRAKEWGLRLAELTQEFTAEPRGGDTSYGMLVALYPTDRPHLPDEEGEKT